MSDSYEIVIRLTQENLPASELHRNLREFASANGWVPADEIDEYPGTKELANGHLLVEHGLTHSAVITFLKVRSPFAHLAPADRQRLLSIWQIPTKSRLPSAARGTAAPTGT